MNAKEKVATTNKGTLRYLRVASKQTDHPDGGVLYLHTWPTGNQELVFTDNAAAERWAEKESCRFVAKGGGL